LEFGYHILPSVFLSVSCNSLKGTNGCTNFQAESCSYSQPKSNGGSYTNSDIVTNWETINSAIWPTDKRSKWTTVYATNHYA
jgi:hypothetical protein